MHPSIQLESATNSMNRSPLLRDFLLIALARALTQKKSQPRKKLDFSAASAPGSFRKG